MESGITGCLCKGFQLRRYSAVDGILREIAAFIRFSSGGAHQQLDALADVCDGIDMEHALLHCLHDFIAEHQLPDIGCRDDNALPSCESTFFAQLKEALDLVGHAADGLDLAPLVHGTGDCQILADGQAGEGGEDAVQLRAGGTVAVDAVVALLKADPAAQAQGELLGIGLPGSP